MRVLILTQYYPPEPAVKFADLARGLCERGHEVQVITGFPCYPAGRTYPGFRQRIYHEEVVDGAHVTRIPQFPDHSRSAIRRALYYLSFALSAVTIGLWRARQADVILVYQSAMPIGLAAWVISRLKKTPYVLDVVDLWPESVAATGMMRKEFGLRLIRIAMKFIYRGAHRINVITKGYWQNLVELGVPKEKLSLIHCWPGAGQFDPIPRDPDVASRFQLVNKFNVVYAGAMGPVQGLATVIEAAELLKDKPNIQFFLLGDGIARHQLEELATAHGVTNVRFLGQLPSENVQQFYSWADALLVHLKPDPMSAISIPSKTFAYLAAGRPIIMAVEGESAELVEEYKCGVAVHPSNPRSLADAIRHLKSLPEREREALGHAGRSAYLSRHSSERQIDKFEEILSETASDGKPDLKASFYRRRGKRILDLALGAVALVIAAPLMAAAAAVVKWKLGSPVLFRQQRPGLEGELFDLVKLRSMRDTVDSEGRPLADELRLTRLGRFLRSTSLDELPELWNIFRGEMSFVGPRPLLPEYLDRFSAEQSRRHEVRPGLTGWAQVHGRNELSWEEKFRHDVWYVDNMSLWLDLKILVLTVWTVVSRAGVSQPGRDSVEKFVAPKNVGLRPSTDEESVIVLGGGGHAKVVVSALRSAGLPIYGIFDDNPRLLGQEINGVVVCGTISDLPRSSRLKAVIAIGDPAARQRIARRYSFNWVTVVHSAACVDPSVVLGEGTVVMAGAVVQPSSRLGRHVIVNTAATVDHDCELLDYSHVCPGSNLAGAVRLGERAVFGTGAVAIPGIEIGHDVVVGAGAVVIKSLPARVTAVGNPARVVAKFGQRAQAA